METAVKKIHLLLLSITLSLLVVRPNTASAVSLQTLYSCINNGAGTEPQAALVQGNDGNFYGTTFAGGTNALGTIFSIAPTGGVNDIV